MNLNPALCSHSRGVWHTWQRAMALRVGATGQRELARLAWRRRSR